MRPEEIYKIADEFNNVDVTSEAQNDAIANLNALKFSINENIEVIEVDGFEIEELVNEDVFAEPPVMSQDAELALQRLYAAQGVVGTDDRPIKEETIEAVENGELNAADTNFLRFR